MMSRSEQGARAWWLRFCLGELGVVSVRGGRPLLVADWWGLSRIVIWCAVFLVVAAFLSPPRQPRLASEGRMDKPLVPMLLEPGSFGWVRSDLDSFAAATGDRRRVAWIGGSSVLVGGRGRLKASLPKLVAKSVVQDTGVGLSVPFYFQAASRILDTQVLLDHALEMRPDAVVLTMNPYWIFNNKAVLNKGQALEHGAANWWTLRDWRRQLALVPPRTHFKAHLGDRLPRPWRPRAFQAWVDDSVTPWLVAAGPEKVERQVQPLAHWIQLGAFGGEPQTATRFASEVRFWQQAAISVSDTDPDSWAARLVERMLRELRSSGIPALVYCPPVAPELAEYPAAAAAHSRVLDAMADLRAVYGSPRLRIITEFPRQATEELSFRDLLHLHPAGVGPLSDHLSAELVALLELS